MREETPIPNFDQIITKVMARFDNPDAPTPSEIPAAIVGKFSPKAGTVYTMEHAAHLPGLPSMARRFQNIETGASYELRVIVEWITDESIAVIGLMNGALASYQEWVVNRSAGRRYGHLAGFVQYPDQGILAAFAQMESKLPK